MFEKMTPLSESGKAAVKAEIAALEARLAIQQQQIKEAGLPVIVLLEGWGASGKGSLIRDIIRSIDPRRTACGGGSAQAIPLALF